mmetsp:Transcript_5515/g.16852  ORF Transcript_5515/g.16852 Transcript_5515/m.16852 type:complete len:363 (+) Transcript_5515:987-2075(+)
MWSRRDGAHIRTQNLWIHEHIVIQKHHPVGGTLRQTDVAGGTRAHVCPVAAYTHQMRVLPALKGVEHLLIALVCIRVRIVHHHHAHGMQRRCVRLADRCRFACLLCTNALHQITELHQRVRITSVARHDHIHGDMAWRGVHILAVKVSLDTSYRLVEHFETPIDVALTIASRLCSADVVAHVRVSRKCARIPAPVHLIEERIEILVHKNSWHHLPEYLVVGAANHGKGGKPWEAFIPEAYTSESLAHLQPLRHLLETGIYASNPARLTLQHDIITEENSIVASSFKSIARQRVPQATHFTTTHLTSSVHGENAQSHIDGRGHLIEPLQECTHSGCVSYVLDRLLHTTAEQRFIVVIHTHEEH